MKTDPKVSEIMKRIRQKRTDYSTSGFSDPGVREKALATRKARNADKKAIEGKDTASSQKSS